MPNQIPYGSCQAVASEFSLPARLCFPNSVETYRHSVRDRRAPAKYICLRERVAFV